MFVVSLISLFDQDSKAVSFKKTKDRELEDFKKENLNLYNKIKEYRDTKIAHHNKNKLTESFDFSLAEIEKFLEDLLDFLVKNYYTNTSVNFDNAKSIENEIAYILNTLNKKPEA
jgi:hypothetical protein